jgi:peptide deformylase
VEIHCYPEHVLRRRAMPVRRITDEIWQLSEGMLETMYEAPGIGLAAPQVGESLCLITVDVTGEHQDPRVFVNPTIVDRRGEDVMEEGCLSLPGITANVRRAERISIVAYDLEGRKMELDADGLTARCLQHEIDHLRGVLFVDHLTPADQMAVRSLLKDLEREFQHQDS